MNREHIELIKLVNRITKDYGQYDELSIYELKDKFEIITKSIENKYVTRTYVGKCSWKIINSFYTKCGEEEVEIFIKKTKNGTHQKCCA